MRVVMIGHSNVGKTTYMASMYAAMQQGVNGFTLRAKDRRDHKRFLSLHHGVRKSHYPAPSDQRAEYEFLLCHNGREVFPFKWVDIRGGTILDRANSDGSKALVKDLAASDGVLVFCDAAAAARGDSDVNEMARISLLLSQAMTNRKRPIAMGLVFTKADLIDGINDAVLEPVRSLLECMDKNTTISRALIPVACGPSESNVAIPVLFTLRHGIATRVNGLVEKIERLEAQAAVHQTKANEWFGLTDWWRGVNGETTYAQRSAQSLAAAQRQLKKLRPLIEPIQQLEELVNQIFSGSMTAA